MFRQGNISTWVLGWKFNAGERIAVDKDVFGDKGTFDVFLTQNGPQSAAVFSK